MTTARDLMTGTPVTVTPATTLGEAARILQTLDIRHLPVVDEEGTLVGMLSDRDLRGLTTPVALDADAVAVTQPSLGARVASAMSSDVLRVEAEDDVAVVVELMLEYKVGAVPVVDADGALVGIVSYVDVLREMPLGDARA
jgi:acetoin utilization protein AcuB